MNSRAGSPSNIETWDEIYQKDKFENLDLYPTKQLQAFVRHHVANSLEKKFLDIGCGTGVSTNFLTNFCAHVVAIDASKEAIAKARQLNSAALGSGRVSFFIADFRDLSFLADEEFDFISSDAVLYYGTQDDFVQGVNEVYRLLKKNGVARIYTKSNRDSYTIGTGQKVAIDTYQIVDEAVYEYGLTLYCPSLESVKNIFAKFKSVKIGIEEFNFIETNRLHSYWIITCTK